MTGGNLEWKDWLERMGRGDVAARNEVLERAYERLRRLSGHMLRQSFPMLLAHHEGPTSVLHASFPRLLQALEKVTLPTPADFFRFTAYKIRQELLNMAKSATRRPRPGGLPEDSSAMPCFPDPQADDAARMAMWTAFHQKVEQLPEQERSVFELYFYLGMSQAEVATTLQLSPSNVSRAWKATRAALADYLPE